VGGGGGGAGGVGWGRRSTPSGRFAATSPIKGEEELNV